MKIGNKISFAFFAITTLIIIIVSPILYVTSKGNLQRTIYSHLTTTAQSRAHHIETFLEEHKQTTEATAAGIIFKELLSTSKDDPEYNQKLEVVSKRINNIKKIHEEFFKICLMDKNGIVITSTDEACVSLNRSAEECYIKGKKATYIEDMHIHKPTETPHIDIAAPVLLNGKALGVIAIQLKAEELFKIVLDRTGLGETGEIYLVNKDKYMISPSRFKEDVILKQKVDTENVEKCLMHKDREYVRGVEEITVFPDYRGVMVLGTHEYIPEMQWCLLAEIDEGEALAPLNKIKLLFVIVIFSGPIIAWVISIFVARFIARPIVKLHKASEIIGAGNLDYKVGTGATDEIGQFSRAFDRMIENFKKTTASRDDLVREVEVRKKAEEALRKSEERFRQIVENAQEWIWELDANGLYTYASPIGKKILGYKPEELVGKKYFYNLLHPEDREELKRISFEAFDKKQAFREFISRNVHRNGKTVWLSTSGVPILDEKGNLLGYRGADTDITGRKQAEEKLKEAMNIKSKFTSMVSHEMRTPLTAIKGGIDIVLDGSSGEINEEQKDFLDTAKRNVDRLHRLINNVLDFAKLEAGKEEFTIKENNINKIIKETVETQKAVTEEKGLYLKMELDPSLRKIRFDSDRIMQVLTNLINNAIKFTKEGGITVKSVRDDEKRVIRVSVKDTGRGIKEENISKIFSKFEQAGRKTGGTGLGLAICKEIVERHGGRIWAKSKYGVGSEFIFTLPLEKEG